MARRVASASTCSPLAPWEPSWASRAANGDALGAVRERVLEKPLTCLATAFAFGLLMARVLR